MAKRKISCYVAFKIIHIYHIETVFVRSPFRYCWFHIKQTQIGEWIWKVNPGRKMNEYVPSDTLISISDSTIDAFQHCEYIPALLANKEIDWMKWNLNHELCSPSISKCNGSTNSFFHRKKCSFSLKEHFPINEFAKNHWQIS